MHEQLSLYLTAAALVRQLTQHIQQLQHQEAGHNASTAQLNQVTRAALTVMRSTCTYLV